jgi:hypothetical protein
MKWLQILRSLALAASLPLIALSALAAWYSLERLYTAYLITHDRPFSDDLTHSGSYQDRLLRFWYRSKCSPMSVTGGHIN